MSDLLDMLLRDRVALSRRQAEADRVIAASGAGHLVHEMNGRADGGGRPWRIDPIPVLLDGATFDQLASAVAGRLRAFEAVLADLYGPRQLIRDGVVPGEALSSTPRYRVATVGTTAPSRWLTTYAVDVIALADGSWRLVQDYTDAPAGIGYALLDRSAMLRVADEILGPAGGQHGPGELASLNGFPSDLRHALVTGTSVPSPRIVLYTGGVNHPGYVEHSSLARTLGFTLVERPDLVVRQGRLWLRTIEVNGRGLDPIDVVYRRVESDRIDPIETASAGSEGVPGLLAAVGDGGVVLSNAHGSGLIEDRSLAEFWSAAAEAVTGSTLSLAPLGDAAERIGLAEQPVFRAGEVSTAPVVVRLHAVAGPDGISVMPGGNGRVLTPGDDPREPTAHRAKDVWVTGRHAALPVVVAPPLPQVDLASSVPTRAADALFWAGRAAERAEAIAKTVRVVAARRRQDPGIVLYAAGGWTRRVVDALRAVAGIEAAELETAEQERRLPFVELDAALAAATRALIVKLREFVAEAVSVGEFLSSNTARSLNSIVHLLDSLGEGAAPIDAIDDVLAALAAFMGMWNESTVRGPAWRFGEMGIRAERALVVLQLTSACLGDESPADDTTDDEAEIDLAGGLVMASAIETLLATNDSLVAYRRQYRSDVAWGPAVDLLIRDRDNPRAYVSSVDRLAEHVGDIGWAGGAVAVSALAGQPIVTAPGATPKALAAQTLTATNAVISFIDVLISRWFATPVKPMLMRAIRR